MTSEAPQTFTFHLITRDDLAMIHEWMQRPHVAAWWDASCTLADVEDDYLPSIDGRSTTQAYVAKSRGQPIGFI